MRTSVTTPDDDQDEFPGCGAMVDERGGLTICTEDMTVETQYEPGEWTEVLVVVE